MVVARIVHILSASIWVGGTVFLVAVAVPFARSFDPERSTEIASAVGRRFRPIAWGALGGLVASGVYTMQRSGLLSWNELSGSGYGRLLLAKLTLVAALLVLAAVHDFVLGPRVEVDPSGRPVLLVLARLNGVLTLVIPIIGVLLAH